MRKIIIFSLAIVISSCGQRDDPDSPEARRNVELLAKNQASKNESRLIDLNEYIIQAHEIFKACNIPTRKHPDKDGQIEVFVVENDTTGIHGLFEGRGRRYLNNVRDGFNMVYDSPKVYILNKLAGRLNNRSDTLEMYKARATLIHEMAHYLDTNKLMRSACRLGDIQCSILDKWETIPYYVGAYYYMKNQSPVLFKSIMGRTAPMVKKNRALLELYMRETRGFMPDLSSLD